jgi:hypothetical protein
MLSVWFEMMEDSPFETPLRVLCTECFRFYELYRSDRITWEEYLRRLQPLDTGVDDLELSLVSIKRLCRRGI